MRGDGNKPFSTERLALLTGIDVGSLYQTIGERRFNAVSSDNLLYAIQVLGFNIEIIASAREITSAEQEVFNEPRRTLAERIAAEPGIRRTRSEMLSHLGNPIRIRIQDTSAVARKGETAKSTSKQAQR